MSKVFKALLIAWFLNLAIFTAAIFLYEYYAHHSSWVAGAWANILFTSSISKVVLSSAIIVYGSTRGVCGTKGDST